MKKLLGVYFAVALFTSCGCGITEGAKQANSQNGKAGELIEVRGRDLNDPELAQMGKDVKENADTVGREIGAPEVDKPYTPENSKDARESAASALTAREEGKSFLWQIATAAAGFVGVGGVVGWLRSALSASRLSTFASVATSVVETIPDLKKKISDKAVSKGVAAVVDKVVQDHA